MFSGSKRLLLSLVIIIVLKTICSGISQNKDRVKSIVLPALPMRILACVPFDNCYGMEQGFELNCLFTPPCKAILNLTMSLEI